MTILLYLLSIHFVADFVLQSDWMAQNKSKDVRALSLHVLVYSACFLFLGIDFAVLTFIGHFITDAITSRINRRLWDAKQVHWFFVSVGFDQLLHAWQLALIWQFLFS